MLVDVIKAGEPVGADATIKEHINGARERLLTTLRVRWGTASPS